MSQLPFDAGRHLDTGLATLGLPIAEEWRPDAVAHLEALKRAADLIMALDLPEDAEPAAIFSPAPAGAAMP